MSLGPGDHARLPVEAHPDNSGDVVTFDAPVTSEGTDDVEAVAPAGIRGSFKPGSAVVFYLDPDVVAGVDLGSYSELPARQAGAAVQRCVRRQLRGTQDHVVRHWAAVK